MLDRIDRLVFYYTIECALCHNVIKVSHVTIEEQQGKLVCSLCGKPVNVPGFEPLVKATKDLNAFLSDKMNAKFIKLVLNPAYHFEEEAAAAH